MAVAAGPNSRYIVNTVLEELRQISKAAGQWTDVKTVALPSFYPLEEGGALSPGAMALDAPALLVWIDKSGDDPTRSQLGGSLAGFISLIIVGVVKEPVNLQLALLDLAEDVKGKMLYNPGRIYPGASGNTFGMSTVNSTPFGYGVHSGSQSFNIGVFLSGWTITYRFTSPGG